MSINRNKILLSTQRALIGMITKNMKAITVGFSNYNFTLRIYFGSQPNEKELELMKDITGEISADIPEFTDFREESIIVDSEKQVNQFEKLDTWVYMEYFPKQ